MPGLVPGIHAAPLLKIFKAGCSGTAWMAGTSPAMTTSELESANSCPAS
jgi:hypothetical protein